MTLHPMRLCLALTVHIQGGPVSNPKIYLAFRFHVNFYHSYRGDTPDELGFGKDIRIIRKIIQVLDRFNAQGVPVRGTWDIENYFSLEKITIFRTSSNV